MKKETKTLGESLTGKGREYIPNIAFSIMTFFMKIMDIFGNYSNKNFNTLGLKEGQTVVDYGCGPARYVVNASRTVGQKGLVYAVDIHPMAILNVNKKIDKYRLTNVVGVLANGYGCNIPDNSADVVYALDMFHMIEQPDQLLIELARMVKPDGRIIIEDGHQPRSETKNKIKQSKSIAIESENKHHVVCRKVQN